MKKRRLGLGLFIILLSITSISAGIYFSQPKSYYNLGDVIEVGAEVDPILEGFLRIDLICEGGTVNVFNGLPNENGKVYIKFPLTFSYIKENSGNCYFYAEYFGLTGRSVDFEISKALEINLDLDNIVAKPGEEVVVSGTARRLNGVGIDGDVEITIPLLKLKTSDIADNNETEVNETEEIEENANETEDNANETEIIPETSAGSFYGKVINGTFSVNFSLLEDTPAGDYRIDVKAYERDSTGRITSEGTAMANLEVEQVLTSIEIAVDSLNADPGEKFNFKPILLDQAGNPISDQVSVIIRNENLDRIFEKIFTSGETIDYQIPTNISAGYYEVEVSAGEISAVKKFYINEKAIALFDVKNNTLIVTNIGNIPYKKAIQIDIDGKSFVRNVDLDLGESQEFKLSGNGQSNVRISDGETEISKGVVLTGKVVNVESVKKGFVALNTPIVWIFFIIILGAGVLFFFRNILKKKSFAYPFKESLGKFRKKKEEKVGDSVKESNLANKAEQVLVLNGHKVRVAVLVLKIKNKLSKNARKNLERIIQPIYDKKGAAYEKEDYLIGIFSPLMTKTYKNEVIAVKIGELIKSSLDNYNKKFADKIEFGIAVSSGEVINKIENGKLKFTALGSLISNAKRMAGSSNGEILLTKEAYNNAGPEIKAVKKGEIFEVKKIIETEKNKEFIDGFLKRIGAGRAKEN